MTIRLLLIVAVVSIIAACTVATVASAGPYVPSNIFRWCPNIDCSEDPINDDNHSILTRLFSELKALTAEFAKAGKNHEHYMRVCSFLHLQASTLTGEDELRDLLVQTILARFNAIDRARQIGQREPEWTQANSLSEQLTAALVEPGSKLTLSAWTSMMVVNVHLKHLEINSRGYEGFTMDGVEVMCAYVIKIINHEVARKAELMAPEEYVQFLLTAKSVVTDIQKLAHALYNSKPANAAAEAIKVKVPILRTRTMAVVSLMSADQRVTYNDSDFNRFTSTSSDLAEIQRRYCAKQPLMLAGDNFKPIPAAGIVLIGMEDEDFPSEAGDSE